MPFNQTNWIEAVWYSELLENRDNPSIYDWQNISGTLLSGLFLI